MVLLYRFLNAQHLIGVEHLTQYVNGAQEH